MPEKYINYPELMVSPTLKSGFPATVIALSYPTSFIWPMQLESWHWSMNHAHIYPIKRPIKISQTWTIWWIHPFCKFSVSAAILHYCQTITLWNIEIHGGDSIKWIYIYKICAKKQTATFTANPRINTSTDLMDLPTFQISRFPQQYCTIARQSFIPYTEIRGCDLAVQ